LASSRCLGSSGFNAQRVECEEVGMRKIVAGKLHGIHVTDANID
jgi:hypothetical protein